MTVPAAAPPSPLPWFLQTPAVLSVFGAFLLAAAASDPLAYPESYRQLWLVRLAWGGSFLALGLAARTPGSRAQRWAPTLAMLFTPLFGGAFAWLCGGAGTSSFQWFVAVPLVLVVFLRASPAGAALGSVAMLAVTAALLRETRASPDQVAQWSVAMAVCCGISIYAAWYLTRLSAAAEASNRARLEAQAEVAEKERRGAAQERLALVGQFASGVAHEINNPLAVISANLSSLGREASPGAGDELKELLTESEAAVQRISSIVKALRAYARESTEGIERIECAAVLEDALRLSGVRAKPGQLHTDIEADLPWVMANEQHLLQGVVGVIGNALDATRDAPAGTAPPIWVRARRDGARVLITVEDEGPGFTPEALQRAGTPFFTTKPPGSGMGLSLAVAREYVRRMGGTLTLENRDPRGARVTVALVPAP